MASRSPDSAFVALFDKEQFTVFLSVVPNKNAWRNDDKSSVVGKHHNEPELNEPYSLPLDEAAIFDVIVAKVNPLDDEQIDRVEAVRYDVAVPPSHHLVMVCHLDGSREPHMAVVANPPLGLWGQLGRKHSSFLPFGPPVEEDDSSPVVSRALKLLHKRRQRFIDFVLAAPMATQARAGTPVHVVMIDDSYDSTYYVDLVDDDSQLLEQSADLGGVMNEIDLLRIEGYTM